MGKLVCGVGINDVSGVVGCPIYRTWAKMLHRVYSAKYHKEKPTYVGCSVVDEWLIFSNFKAWMETQDWEGKHIDKDILCKGNKVYGPAFCVFIDPMVNTFITESNSSRGEYPIGASIDARSNRFVSMVSNPITKKHEYLGYHRTAELAHNAWLVRKLEIAKQIAVLQKDSRVADALIDRYENYQK